MPNTDTAASSHMIFVVAASGQHRNSHDQLMTNHSSKIFNTIVKKITSKSRKVYYYKYAYIVGAVTIHNLMTLYFSPNLHSQFIVQKEHKY